MGVVFEVRIAWGDCDEAGIVFYPNYFYWMDSAFQALLRKNGLSQRLLRERFNVVGTPIVDTGAKFLAPASYDDLLHVHAAVDHWSARSFRVRYHGQRDEVAVFEGFEVRVFAARRENGGIRAAPIDPAFREAMG